MISKNQPDPPKRITMNAENDLRLLMEELVDLFDWEDKTPLHAILHVRNAVLNLRADLAVEKARAEKAEANYAFMVKRAADQHLDGYRELGARCAKLEAERDEARSKLRAYETAPIHMEAHVLRARLRETAQILIEAVGADGPMDAEDAARKAVECIDSRRRGTPCSAPGCSDSMSSDPRRRE